MFNYIGTSVIHAHSTPNSTVSSMPVSRAALAAISWMASSWSNPGGKIAVRNGIMCPPHPPNNLS